MPNYSYICSKCDSEFELFFYIKDYNPKPNCIHCGSKNTDRNYNTDILSQSASVKKADSELKTLGDLAKRNTDRMSNDQKSDLYRKHNSYREKVEDAKPLPKGMSRIKKPPKTIWPS